MIVSIRLKTLESESYPMGDETMILIRFDRQPTIVNQIRSKSNTTSPTEFDAIRTVDTVLPVISRVLDDREISCGIESDRIGHGFR